MARLLTLFGALAVFAGSTYLLGVSRWSLGLGLLAMSGAVWIAARCTHRGPLALLPSTFDEAGNRLPPRWYCPDCGAKWVAMFEHDTHPVTRFSGYEPAKAVASARRARALEERQRELALVRAGLRTFESPTFIDLTHADVIPMRAPSAARKNSLVRPAS